MTEIVNFPMPCDADDVEYLDECRAEFANVFKGRVVACHVIDGVPVLTVEFANADDALDAANNLPPSDRLEVYDGGRRCRLSAQPLWTLDEARDVVEGHTDLQQQAAREAGFLPPKSTR